MGAGERRGKTRVLETQRSRHFSNAEGTTTYATVELASGDQDDVILETIFDQPTVYPLDPELNGVSADYALFRDAQMFGEREARHRTEAQNMITQAELDHQENSRRRWMERVRRRATEGERPALPLAA